MGYPVIDYSASELETLRAFIEEIVIRWRDGITRSDLQGVASGSIFNVLRQLYPNLARKVGDRKGLVSLAEHLGFDVHSGPGGRGLLGPDPWEFIDLHD